ncbi:MAG: tetratricopeptide repeat protein [Roseiflexaceae bacterium]
MTPPELETITTFGSYLRFLRRRARLTQTELGIAVGYSPGQISMLEHGQRSADPITVAALFVSALGIEADEPRRLHLLRLAEAAMAAQTRHPLSTTSLEVSNTLIIEREELGQLEEVPTLPSYVVMRQQQRDQIIQCFAHEPVVALSGLAGMGKSTLATQIATLPHWPGGVFWLTCTEATNHAPETILRQLALFAATRISHPQRIAAAIRPHEVGAPPIGYHQHLSMVAAALAEIPQHLLVFDDAHLLSQMPTLAQLVNRIRSVAPTSRILLIAREAIDLPGIAQIHLDGMAASEIAELHEHLAPHRPLDLQQIHQQIGGSPMLLRLAISHWEQQQASMQLPFPVANYLIETILNTLSPSARNLLDLLAIWQGSLDLTTPIVADLCGRTWPTHAHHAGLNLLQRSRMIEQIDHAAPHPLLREPLLIALNTQPAYRRQLHQLAAKLAFHHQNPISAIHHLAQADQLERAVAVLLEQPIDRLVLGRANQIAHIVEEVLAAIRQRQHHDPAAWESRKRQLLVLQGDLLFNTTRNEQAQASYYAALELTRTALEQAQLAEKIAQCAYRRSALEEALTLCEQATAVLGLQVSQDAIRQRIQIESTRMRILIGMARFAEARQICETVLTIVRPFTLILPNLAGMVRAYANLALGYIARFQGENEQARQFLHKSAQQARSVHATSVEIDALQYLSATLRDLGRLDDAEQTGQQALELAHTAGNEYLTSSILHHLSLSDYYHADLQRAIWRTERVLQLKTPIGDIEGIVASRMVRAITLAAQGDLTAAMESAHQAARDCDLLENSWLRGIADYGYAVVLSFTDDLAAAERAILRALATDMLKLDHSFYNGARMYCAMIYVAQGRLNDANDILAAPLPPSAGYSAELLRSLVQGMWHLANGQAAQARCVAEQLIQRAEQVGFRIYALEAAQLMRQIDSPLPLATLPRRICCPITPPITVDH